jgi:predicted YcjX-like family ATPase
MLKLPALGALPDWLTDAANLTELAKGSTVWLAVTGLSRAGKTVFITSLIHNLLSALHNPNRMPLLKVVGEGRLLAAKLEGSKAHRLPRFPYLANIEQMANTPAGRLTNIPKTAHRFSSYRENPPCRLPLTSN